MVEQAVHAEEKGAVAANAAAVASAKSVVAQHDAKKQAQQAVAGATPCLSSSGSPGGCGDSGGQPLQSLQPQAIAPAKSSSSSGGRLGVQLELQAAPGSPSALELRCMLTWHLPL